MQAGVTVSFYGVRGSTPCHCSSMARFGGNTSCVVVQREGEAPIICDSGTGLRFYGLDMGDEAFDGTVLISHLHWDHVQGLPFFPPILNADSNALILGPPENDMSFEEALSGFVRPPYFPIELNSLPGDTRFADLWNDTVEIGTARVSARSVPHIGVTNGYRIEWDDFSMAYIPDHQQPADVTTVDAEVLELVDNVDLLIHDSQFTPELLTKRSNWGHCTPRYAATVADAGSAKCLAMFHHDPLHGDDAIDELLAEAQSWDTSCNIIAAAEGVKLSF
jgi:phosphoribosyl 1,2-cyclic phosphodiesterase